MKLKKLNDSRNLEFKIWITNIIVGLILVISILIFYLYDKDQYFLKNFNKNPVNNSLDYKDKIKYLEDKTSETDEIIIRNKVESILNAKQEVLVRNEALLGRIISVNKENTLWENKANDAKTPASTTKMLTAFAAINILDLNSRIKTEVFSSKNDEEIIIKGGGDPTISNDNKKTYYSNAAKLIDLAKQIEKNINTKKIKKIIIDNSVYKDSFAKGWYEDDIQAGNIAPVESIMLDGGRNTQIKTHYSQKSNDPIREFGQELAKKLNLKKIKLEVTQIEIKKQKLITFVESAPLFIRLREMIADSDNVLAETIGREIAIKQGYDTNFLGSANAVKKVLKENGISIDNIELNDTSGLSDLNKISPTTLTDIMLNLVKSEKSEAKWLVSTLPVGGVTGTLENRFYTDDARSAIGKVVGKTGTLKMVNTLVGEVLTKSGVRLVFTFMLYGKEYAAGDEFLDSIISEIYNI